MISRKATVLCITVLALGAASAASAESSQFRYGDLDLTSEAGRAELDRRIETAAKRACPAEEVTGSRISQKQAREQCMANVRQQIATHMASRTVGGSSSR